MTYRRVVSMEGLQPHLKLKPGDVAPIVLIPGDPARVRRIAEYWDTAREVMFNREFLTYTGRYRGIPVSATSTGIGGPSASIAVEELTNAGARILLRIGTCGAFKKEILPGDLIIPTRAERAEGTTHEYVGDDVPAVPDDALRQLLESAALRRGYRTTSGPVRSHDAFYERIENLLRWRGSDLIGSEMECSAVFVVAALRGVRSAAVLAVNTAEPLDEIAAHPEAAYELIESPDADAGVDRAIQVALDAVEELGRQGV